jgi:hypothetical protein
MVEGADLKNAQARLILENDEYSLLFKGNIDSDGKCSIDIRQLKFLSENLKGKMKLEVIVDNDTYFIPYEDDFIVDVSKKVRVEVIQTTSPLISDKKVVVKVNNPNKLIKSPKILNTLPIFEIAIKEAYDAINDDTIKNLKPLVKKFLIKEMLQEVIDKYKIPSSDISKFNRGIIQEIRKNKL